MSNAVCAPATLVAWFLSWDPALRQRSTGAVEAYSKPTSFSTARTQNTVDSGPRAMRADRSYRLILTTMHRAPKLQRALHSRYTTRHHKSPLQRALDTNTCQETRHRRQLQFIWPRCRLARARGSAYALAVRARGSHRMHMYIYGAMCAHVLVRARARPSWPPVARARAFELL